MKKWLLGLVMVLALTGCGGAEVDEEDAEKKDKVNTENVEDEADKGNAEAGDVEVPEEEKVLYSYDSEQVYFEVQSVNPDAPEGYEMKLLFENKIEGFELNYALEEFAVQRYSSDAYANYIWEHNLGTMGGTVSVDPLSTKEVTVYLNRDDLAEVGITTVDEISFNFRVWNWDYIDREDVAYETAQVYPTGLDKDSVVVPEVKQTEGMKTVLDNEIVRIVCLGFTVDEDGELQAQYWAENKTDTFMRIDLRGDDSVLNGQHYDTDWYVYLNGNNRCYRNIGFYREEESGLANIVSPEQVSGLEATAMILYYDEEMNRCEETYRIVY